MCSLFHLLLDSVCWNTLKALGSQHWVLFCRNLLSVFQCTALCVLTVSPVARQRVLGHVKGPWQSALGAVLPKSVECVSVHSTLCAHCFTCCSTACAVPSWHCALSYLLDPNCCVVLTFANRLATSQCCSLVGQQLCVVSAGAIVELADFLLPNSRGDLMRDLMPYCSWELPYLQDGIVMRSHFVSWLVSELGSVLKSPFSLLLLTYSIRNRIRAIGNSARRSLIGTIQNCLVTAGQF